MSAMSLTQLPAIPQRPGQPAFYPPDKIPKGAIVAFMPVVLLPEEFYANCNENIAEKFQGVQPSFSLHSVFTGGAPKDQCMCPCSCTQNKLHKRETNPDDAVEAKPVKVEEDLVAEADTVVEVKVAAPVAASEEIKAEATSSFEEGVDTPATPLEVPEAAASTPVEVKVAAPEVKVDVVPVADAATPAEVKVEAPLVLSAVTAEAAPATTN